MNNNSNTDNSQSPDFNPFRHNEQPPFTDIRLGTYSPHVAFTVRSPSIIPSPVYDDNSSYISTTYTSVGTSATPSPLPAVAEEKKMDAFDSKVQVQNNTNYGPRFGEDEEDDHQNQHVLSEGSLLTKGFKPKKELEEEIQMYDTRPHLSPEYPEQSRVDIFMSKLKGYERPIENNNPATSRAIPGSNPHTFHKFGSPPTNQQSIPKRKNLFVRQLFGGGNYPIFVWITSIAMIAVFVYELIESKRLSGSVIQTNPFNPMVGPNYMALISMGSKFVPCIRSLSNYTPSTTIASCYTLQDTCTLESLCGLSPGSLPNQSFRFFVPIFLHAGVIHIVMNLISYFQLGARIEYELGFIRFGILFIGSGIWSFILSGTLSGTLSSSMGCSGALFGLLGYEIVDIIIHWKELNNPCSKFIKLLIIVVISFVIGLLPGLDNFAHIGGFVMGIVLSGLLASKRPTQSKASLVFVWVTRIICLILAIVLYVVFLKIFYSSTDLNNVCPKCKYFSCLPVNGWCDI